MTVRLGCTVFGLETQPGPVGASAPCHFDRRVSISFGAESSSGARREVGPVLASVAMPTNCGAGLFRQGSA